jgi:hypothetical protein
MPNKLISMHVLRRMILLIQRDFSDRNIAIELNLSRVTVGQYHRRIRSTSKNCEELLALGDARYQKTVAGRVQEGVSGLLWVHPVL